MRRILVVADRRVSAQRFRGAVERLPDGVDVFVLYAVGNPGAPRLLGRRRFWRTRHAELDELLTELSAKDILSDGIVVLNPLEALRRAVETFRPDELVLFRTPGLGLNADAIGRVAEVETGSGAASLPTAWLDA